MHISYAGLISAVPAAKKGDKGALQVAAQQVEAMVKAKMGKPEYTILCLEDNSDWTNATTRRLVMAVRLPWLLPTMSESSNRMHATVPTFEIQVQWHLLGYLCRYIPVGCCVLISLFLVLCRSERSRGLASAVDGRGDPKRGHRCRYP